MHYGESIMPPLSVDWICIICCLLFYATSNSVLATAFSWVNAKGGAENHGRSVDESRFPKQERVPVDTF